MDGLRPEMKVFYELLMITFSTKKEHYDDLKKRYNHMIANNEAEIYDELERKIAMLIEEISCFVEISDDLAYMLASFDKNRTEQEVVRSKMRKLDASSASIVGFFNKKTKQEKMREYMNRLNSAQEHDTAYSILLNVLPQVIIKYEIDKIKSKKNLRYNDAMMTYATKKQKALEECYEFWSCANEERIEEEFTSSRIIVNEE